MDDTNSLETHPIVVETFTAVVDPKVGEEQGQGPHPASFGITRLLKEHTDDAIQAFMKCKYLEISMPGSQ